MRNKRPTKGDKREIRQETHLTRPPRLEGVAKERVQPKRKPKTKKPARRALRKARSYSAQQVKEYQLRSKHH